MIEIPMERKFGARDLNALCNDYIWDMRGVVVVVVAVKETNLRDMLGLQDWDMRGGSDGGGGEHNFYVWVCVWARVWICVGCAGVVLLYLFYVGGGLWVWRNKRTWRQTPGRY